MKFDSYTLQARVWPGTLALLPVTVMAALLSAPPPLRIVMSLLGAAGVPFLVVNWIRDRGKDCEEILKVAWDGLPTTRRLRWNGNDHGAVFRRRRRVLEQVTGIVLPTQAEERASPEEADAVYVDATRAFIVRSRGKGETAKLLQKENVAFGFRRNMLGLRVYAVCLAAAGCVVSAFWALSASITRGGASLAVDVAMILVWGVLVSPDWVKRQAEVYADTLFSLLDDPAVTNGSEPLA